MNMNRKLAGSSKICWPLIFLWMLWSWICTGLGNREIWETWIGITTVFPTPVEMIQDFEDLGVKTILITEPYVTEQSTNFDLVTQNEWVGTDPQGNPQVVPNFWAGPAVLLDLFKTRGTRLVLGALRRPHPGRYCRLVVRSGESPKCILPTCNLWMAQR
jgi:hypothetical protein